MTIILNILPGCFAKNICYQYRLYTNLGARLPFLKSVWNLFYPGQNRDIREILRNLIGLLGNEIKRNVEQRWSEHRLFYSPYLKAVSTRVKYY